MKVYSDYIWSDAWLLQSIAHASSKSPASLKDILKIGDMINHAIFTPGELQHGLNKFLQDKIIISQEQKISLTAEGKKILDAILIRKLEIFDELSAIKTLLNTKSNDLSDKVPEFNPDNRVIYSPHDLYKAAQEYREDFRK